MADLSLRYLLYGQDVNASASMKGVAEQAAKTGQQVASGVGKIGGFLGGEVGELMNRVSEGLNSIGESGHGIAPKLAVGGAAVTGLGTALSLLSSKDQAAHAQLDAAISASGKDAGDYAEEIEKTIHTQENFGHSASDTQDALAKMTAALGSPTKAMDEMGVVADLAASRHEDLSAAADQVDKILAGKGAKTLSQYGITMATTGDKTANAKAALDELATKLQGQASASVDSFGGKLKVLTTHLADEAAVIGAKYGPAITGAGVGLQTLATVMQVVQARQAAAAAATAAATVEQDKQTVAAALQADAAAHAALATEGQSAAESELATSTDAATAAQESSKLAMLGTAGAAGAAIAVIYEAGQAVDAWRNRNDALAKSLSSSASTIDSFTQALQATNGAMNDQARAAAATALQHDGLAGKAQAAGISLAQLTTAVTGNNTQFDQLIETWKKSGKPSDDTLTAMKFLHAEMGGAQATAAQLADAQKALGDTGTDAAAGASAAAAALKAEQDAAAAAQKVLDNYSTTLDKVLGVNISAAQAGDSFKDQLDTLTSTIEKNGRTLDDNTTKGRANRDAILASIKSAVDHAAAIDKQTGSIDQANTVLSQDEAALQKQAKAAGLSATQVQNLVDQMGSVKDVQATVTVDANQAYAALTTVDQQLAYIATLAGKDQTDFVALSTKFNASFPDSPVSGNSRPAGRAVGGAMADGLALVGEQGPELAMKSGANVSFATAPQTSGLLSGMGSSGNVTVHVTVQGNVQAERDLAMSIATVLDRDNVRNGRVPVFGRAGG